MSLKGPTDNEDLHKIHNEIAQIVQQRMTNTIFAITLLGIFGIFTIHIPTLPSGTDIEPFLLPLLLGSSLLLSCILFIVYVYNYCLTAMLRIFTTYLKVTKQSGWEEDWAKYRKRRYFYFGYTKAQTMVFLPLILISTFWPLVVAKVVYSLKIESSYLYPLNIVLGLIFFVIIFFIGFCKLFDIEHKVQGYWEDLNLEKNDNDKR